MTVMKRTKQSRFRGSHTHGWGSKKKHRGAGNRGGAGHSATEKRADAHKPSIWGDPKFFGKHGFRPKQRELINAIKISDIDHSIDKWVTLKKASKKMQ